MIDPKLTEKLTKCFADAVPPGMRNLYQDMEKNFHVILQNFFSKLDLITREEFDAQKRVLERTRLKVEALEKILREKGLMPQVEDSFAERKNTSAEANQGEEESK